MSFRTSLLAGFCSVIVLTSAPGCGETSSATGSQSPQSEAHSKRNREMQDFMKNQGKKASPAK